MMRSLKKIDWYLLGGLTLAALLLRFINLSHPKEIIFDETYFANFAHNYLTNTKFFDAEPPFGKFLIAGGEWLFGFNSFGWRVMPAVFGAAVIPLMYLLAKRLFGGLLLPLIAGSLALFDGLLLVESRTALLDGFVVFFNLLTYLLFLLSLQASSRKRSLAWLAATGVSLGLGLSLKWITLAFVAPAILLVAVLVVSHRPRIRRFFKVRSRDGLFAMIGAKPANVHGLVTYLGLLGVVPVVLYLGIFSLHVPFDSTGGSIWEIHKQIFNYHHNLTATHPYGSSWYTWPFLIRPVAYYFNGQESQWSGIIALGNPLIWWAGIPAMGYVALRFWKTRSLALLLILAGFVAHYLPWAGITRVLFIYHYLGALPFMMLALAVSLRDLWQWKPRDNAPLLFGWLLLMVIGVTLGGLLGRSVFGNLPAAVSFGWGGGLVGLAILAFAYFDVRGWRWGAKQAITVMALCLLAFIYFYPIWTAVPLSPQDYYRHMWLRSWI